MRAGMVVTGLALTAALTACTTATQEQQDTGGERDTRGQQAVASVSAPGPTDLPTPVSAAPAVATASGSDPAPRTEAPSPMASSTTEQAPVAVDWDSGKGTPDRPNPDPSPQGWYEAAFGTPQSGQDKVLYLTFDDGPGASTADVLDVLARNNATATFFVIGAQAASQPGVVQAIRDGGHQVGNHTWNHPDLTTLAADDVSVELERTTAAAGNGPCMRPPYGAIDAQSGAVSESLNLQPIMWTAQAYDWKSTATSEQIVADLKARTSPGAVVLLHDGGGDRSLTVEALKQLLPYWTAQGYRFGTIPACV